MTSHIKTTDQKLRIKYFRCIFDIDNVLDLYSSPCGILKRPYRNNLEIRKNSIIGYFPDLDQKMEARYFSVENLDTVI